MFQSSLNIPSANSNFLDYPVEPDTHKATKSKEASVIRKVNVSAQVEIERSTQQEIQKKSPDKRVNKRLQKLKAELEKKREQETVTNMA